MAELFADLLGQPLAVALLEAALDRGHLAPAYLFDGPEGVGRALAAERFLEGIVAGPSGSADARRRIRERNHPDLLWIEPTYQVQGRLVPLSRAAEEGVARRARPQVRLEQVRAIGRAVARRPLACPHALVVLEGADLMAEAAANALLKTLEEPGHGRLILIAGSRERLLSTIRSRCQRIPFRPLDSDDVRAVLARRGEHTDGIPPSLFALAGGSPGALLEHRRQWQALPEGLAERLASLTGAPKEALGLAAELTEALDVEEQLWLLGWWQWQLWNRRPDGTLMVRLERLRGQLASYVQPRLAWEVALLAVGESLRRWRDGSPGAAPPSAVPAPPAALRREAPGSSPPRTPS